MCRKCFPGGKPLPPPLSPGGWLQAVGTRFFGVRSVANGFEVEAPGRRRTACVRTAVASAQQPLELGRPLLDHGADQGPHHVAEEAVGLDLELQCVPSPVPGRAPDAPDEDLVLGPGGREGAEVVLTEEQVGGLGEILLVERRGSRGPPPRTPEPRDRLAGAR